MTSDHDKPDDEFSRRLQAKAQMQVTDDDSFAELPDPYEGLNEFEKRKAFNEYKRQILEAEPWLTIPDTSDRPGGALGEMASSIETNYAGFVVKMDFDKYPFPYGKSTEIEFLLAQYRQPKTPELERQLYRKLLRAIHAHESAVYHARKP